MNALAKIEIFLLPGNRVHVNAPLDNKPACYVMLAEAIKGIAQDEITGLMLTSPASKALLRGELPK